MVNRRRPKKPRRIQLWLSLVQAELDPQTLKDYNVMSYVTLFVCSMGLNQDCHHGLITWIADLDAR